MSADWLPVPPSDEDPGPWQMCIRDSTYTIPVPDTSIAPGKRWDVDEVIDEAALQAICESYDPATVSYTHLDVYKTQPYDPGHVQLGSLPTATLHRAYTTGASTLAQLL